MKVGMWKFRVLALGTMSLLQPFMIQSLAASESAQEIVAKADNIRNPGENYFFNSKVITYDGESKEAETGYTVYVSNYQSALVEYTSPSSEQGKSILLQGDGLWIYLPRLKRPTRISAGQRLLGDVAIGDMARLSFRHDYNASLLGSEIAQGQQAYVLDLTAKSEDSTYRRVKYWVAVAGYRPIKAEFYAVSGRIIKTGYFQDFKQAAGEMRPLTITFVDAVNPRKRSILAMDNMQRKKLPDRMFTKSYMKTLE